MLTRFKDSPGDEPDMPECFEDKVMHASIRIGETILMASDGRCEGTREFDGFSLSITVPDEAEADRVFKALSEGGLVTMPLEKTFWAPKFGMLRTFGVGWMVSVMHKPGAADAVDSSSAVAQISDGSGRRSLCLSCGNCPLIRG